MRLLTASSSERSGTVSVRRRIAALDVFSRARSITAAYTSYSPGGSERALDGAALVVEEPVVLERKQERIAALRLLALLGRLVLAPLLLVLALAQRERGRRLRRRRRRLARRRDPGSADRHLARRRRRRR